MSRTEKDKNVRIRYKDDVFTVDVPDQRKKKREYNVVWPDSAPSAWTRTVMNRPHRRECRVWERTVLFSDINEAQAPVEPPKKYHN